jgi:hypothetical protein
MGRPVDQPVFTFTVRALRRPVPAVIRLRAALKCLLRDFLAGVP